MQYLFVTVKYKNIPSLFHTLSIDEYLHDCTYVGIYARIINVCLIK